MAPNNVKLSLPKRSRKSPGGRTMKISKEKKPSSARCAICGAKLMGVPRVSAYNLRKLSKTERRPERPFGGVLCSTCSRSIYKNKARIKEGTLAPEQVDVRHLRYLKQLR